MKATDEQVHALQEIADANEGSLRSYSGRGMYGKECLGIDCENANSVIEDAGAAGIKGARTDSMGLGAIVYWPKLEVPDDFRDDDDEEE